MTRRVSHICAGATTVTSCLVLSTLVCGCSNSSAPAPPTTPLAASSKEPPLSSRYKLVITPTSIRKAKPVSPKAAAQVERVAVREELHDDGTLRRKYAVNVMDDGSEIEHGKSTEYHANGKVYRSGEYRDGKQTGEWIFYYANGNIAKTGSYLNGQPDGEWLVFTKEGLRSRVESFAEGKPDGKWVKYYPDEMTELVTLYRDGGVNGKTIHYGEDGSIVSTIEFRNRKPHGVAQRFYGNGACQQLENYRDGERHGRRTRWDESGEVISDDFFENGVKLEPADWPKQLPDVERRLAP